jgi:hypothetical protein
MDKIPETPIAQPEALLELKAMQEVHASLINLSREGRSRVIAWAVGALEVSLLPSSSSPGGGKTQQVTLPHSQGSAPAAEQQPTPGAHPTFADLFSATSPTTNTEKALVGGYWLQVCQGTENFVSMAVNNELKNLGEGVENITSAFDGLKEVKPQLALQVRKDGKSQQARKRYKLTVAGIRGVEAMIRGEHSDGY